jgi:uncharacterized cofD-like protein
MTYINKGKSHMNKDIKHKKFVTIGNGTGQATILKHLHSYVEDITAIVGVTDNGGHSGLLRRMLNIPAPGDIRNCMSNVCDKESSLASLIRYRFNKGELEGVSLGNLIISALTDIEGDMGKAVEQLGKMLYLKPRILPASIESAQICAELEDGQIIEGEFEIIRRENKEAHIVRMFHKPEITAYAPCLDAVREADVIVISPGTLRTGIISTLLAKGMKEAITKSPARIIFICNIMTNPGQTENFSARDHIEEITRYLGRKPDYTLVHDGMIPDFVQEIYVKERSHPVKHINVDNEDISIIFENLLEQIDENEIQKYQRTGGEHIKKTPHLIRHDARKVASIILELSNN